MENVKEPVPQRLLLRIPEVMMMLGLGRTKIYELIGSGDLPVIRVGKAIRIPVTALEQWVEQRQHQEEDRSV